MNEQEFNLSKLIAETGAKNATGEIKNFADDLDLLSNGLEARFEDIVNQVDKLVNMLDVTKFQLTRNDVFRIRNTLKNMILNKEIKSVNVLYPKMLDSSVEEFKSILPGKKFIDIKKITFIIFVRNIIH